MTDVSRLVMKKIIILLLLGVAIANASPTNNPTPSKVSLTLNLGGEIVWPTNFFKENSNLLNQSVSFRVLEATNLAQRVIKPDGTTVTASTNGAGVVSLSAVEASYSTTAASNLVQRVIKPDGTTVTASTNGAGVVTLSAVGGSGPITDLTNVTHHGFLTVRSTNDPGDYTNVFQTQNIDSTPGVTVDNFGNLIVGNAIGDERGGNLTVSNIASVKSLSVTNDATVYGQLNATNINGVKKYVAMVYQANVTLVNASLTIGDSYIIFSGAEGDDFSNVGFTDLGVEFVATDSDPITWSNGTVVYDVLGSSPVATVQETGLGGAITWRYHGQGIYRGTLPYETTGTVWYQSSPIRNGTTMCGLSITSIDSTTVEMQTFVNGFADLYDEVILSPVPIEIRFYP
ncbi:MAG: hypothetical protein JWM68_376 [Verrucomicrobiales bacterium]|nr:hypothetical protein [Verrucomicrobiales bacterium]